MNQQPTAMTFITLTPDQLEQVCQRAATLAVCQSAKDSGALWSKKQVADHRGVNPRTIDNWVKAGKLCAPVAGRWQRHEIMSITQ